MIWKITCVFCPKEIGAPRSFFQLLFFLRLCCAMHTFILFHHCDVTWQLQINFFDIPQILAYMIKPNGSKDYMWILNSALRIQSVDTYRSGCPCLSVNMHVNKLSWAWGRATESITGENHINSNFDFHDTACLFLLGVGYWRNENIR